MTKRTYYGFQVSYPVWPGEMDVVTTSKPNSYQVKYRASSLSETREKLNQRWNDIC